MIALTTGTTAASSASFIDNFPIELNNIRWENRVDCCVVECEHTKQTKNNMSRSHGLRMRVHK